MRQRRPDVKTPKRLRVGESASQATRGQSFIRFRSKLYAVRVSMALRLFILFFAILSL